VRYTGPPMTLGAAAAARVRLIAWCRDCRHEVEPDPAVMAERYGAELSVPDWHKRLVCGQAGCRHGATRSRVARCSSGAGRRIAIRRPRTRLPD
jgi:hypothetical protein